MHLSLRELSGDDLLAVSILGGSRVDVEVQRELDRRCLARIAPILTQLRTGNRRNGRDPPARGPSRLVA